MVESVIEWVAGLSPGLQVASLLLLGAIPFIESYGGAMIGIILGINPLVVVPLVIIGNFVCTFLLIALAGRVRDRATRNRQGESAEPRSKRQQKVARFLDRFGVPGVAMLGPFVVASQITAPILVGLGANRRSVYIWTGIAIIVWGVAFGLFWTWLLNAVGYDYVDYEGAQAGIGALRH